jgi:hypothetical protein
MGRQCLLQGAPRSVAGMERTADPNQIAPSVTTGESVATFEWRHLQLHVVTREPLSADKVRTIKRALSKVSSVGQFADMLGMVLDRSVQIRTERPSPDIRLEVWR